MKKLICFLLAFLLFGTPVFADELDDIIDHFNGLIKNDSRIGQTPEDLGSRLRNTDFNDLEEAAWAKEDITYLAQRGILAGMTDDTFEPNGTVTRAQYTKMLVLAMGLYDLAAETDFIDLQQSHWSYRFVASAFASDDFASSAFRPDEPITREDMALFTVAIMRKAGWKLPVPAENARPFTDWDEVSAYAKNSVIIMAGQGLINGVGDGRFDPAGVTTRAAAAKVLRGVVTMIG